jgi:hypothetical protein
MIGHKTGIFNLSLTILISTLCFLVSAKPVDAALDAQLMGAVGKVEIRRSQTTAWEKANSGTRLYPGDSIRAGSKSQADIRFQSVSISIYEDSLLELSASPQALLESSDDSGAPIRALFHNGHLQFRTFQKPGERVEVMTSTVIVSGRNATFRTLEKDNLRAVVVSDGSVEVWERECPDEVIKVKAGHYTLLMKNRLTAARKFQPQGFYIEKELMKEQLKLAGAPEGEPKPCLRIEKEEESEAQDHPSSPSFRLTPSGTIAKLYDDNIFFTRNGEEQDIITALAPELRLTTTTKRFSGNLEYRPVFEYFEDHKDLNTTKHFADLAWTAHLSEKSALTFQDHFRFTTDSTEFPLVTLAVPRGDAYANTLTGHMEMPNVDLFYQQEDQYFDLAQLVDGVSRKFEEQMTLPLFAHQSLTQSYRLRFYRLKSQSDFTTVFRSHTAGIGFQHNFSQGSFVGLEGGVSYWRDISDQAFRSEGMVRLYLETPIPLDQPSRPFRVILSYQEDIESQWQVGVDYSMKKTAFGIHYSRELILGSGILAQTLVREGAGVQFRQTMGENIDLNLAATYARYESIGNNLPLFTTYNGTVGFSYAFRPWLKGEIGYNFFIQDSRDLAGLFEFARNQATMGITALLP